MSQKPLKRDPLDPEIDRMFELLGSRQRRLVLLGLATGEVRNLSDLRERTTNRELLEVELEHNHLPKLTESGYVERDGDELSPGPNFEEIEPLLRLLDPREHETRRRRH